jgi:hypothetical protein
MSEIKNIPISKLQCNTGQIEGLPKNPRFIKDYRFQALKKSIKDAPEMLNLRELLVFPFKDKYVVIGGNMRLKACKELGHTEIPCKILPENTPVAKLREYTMKDNNAFGETDWDALNEWNKEELEEWGMELPQFDGADVSPDDFGDEFSLKDGDKEPFQQMTFTMADEQAELIKNAIADCKALEEYKYCETFGNENTNGNALYLIVSQWAAARK